ncbi:MAG: S8 family serine peptidase [Lachnospiraceae bacterium]|nr:S8 family serine peptidase [Lachnospiraceae bacterium]
MNHGIDTRIRTRIALLTLAFWAIMGKTICAVASESSWAYEAVCAEEAADLGYDGSGVRIALLDTGVRESHVVFDGAIIIEGIDYTDTPLGGTRDYIGHGTFLASILVAQPGNSLGITGLAPGAELIPMKCFDEESAGVSVLAQAIYDAVNLYDCDIINMSWGVTEDDAVLYAAVEYAYEQGVILIASAGNDGSSDAVYYPAAWEQVISVGAVNQNMEISSYSQQNETTWLYAPGDSIYGAGHTSDLADATLSGTSYAAAYVTGAAALALQVAPDLTTEELMQASATELGDGDYFLNIGALIALLT